jgi:hypothetical protein
MRYLVRVSFVDVVGHIWMPNAVCSMRYTLSAYDVRNIREHAAHRLDCTCPTGWHLSEPTVDARCPYHLANPGTAIEITREDVEQWLATNSGDFQSIIDFRASIEDGDKTLDFDFATEDGYLAYCDTLPEEND